jgi:hypothetical protein
MNKIADCDNRNACLACGVQVRPLRSQHARCAYICIPSQLGETLFMIEE